MNAMQRFRALWRRKEASFASLSAFQVRKSAVEAMNDLLEKNAVSYGTCKKSCQRSKAGNFNLKDDDRFRCAEKIR